MKELSLKNTKIIILLQITKSYDTLIDIELIYELIALINFPLWLCLRVHSITMQYLHFSKTQITTILHCFANL